MTVRAWRRYTVVAATSRTELNVVDDIRALMGMVTNDGRRLLDVNDVGTYSVAQSTSVDWELAGHAEPCEHQVCC